MALELSRMLALVVAGSALLTSAGLGQSEAASFAAPVRLMAGDKFLGEGRYYPSPVCHDLNGDGLADVVVGDLMGHLTVALRLPGDGPVRFSEETKLKASDGEILDFGNW